MLILGRKVGQSIHVGDSVTVTVLGVARGQVKIGIEAPRELAVHREEIYRRVQDEKSRGEITKAGSSQDFCAASSVAAHPIRSDR